MNGRQLTKKKSPKKSDENAGIRINRKEVQTKVQLNGPANVRASQITNPLGTRSSNALAVIDRREVLGKQVPAVKPTVKPTDKPADKPADKPKSIAVKRKPDDSHQDDDATKEVKHKRIKRRRFKIGCEHVDFVAELGYKQYIQLAISNVFRFLSDKDVAAAFCVSKMWRYVLGQNVGLNRRRLQYVDKQIELRRKLGTVSFSESKWMRQSL